jgi:aconitate hydratase
VGMGVLPLELGPDVTIGSLGLEGSETVDITGIAGGLRPGGEVTVTIRHASGEDLAISCRARLDSSTDVEYFEHGGVLPRVLRLKLADLACQI